MRPGNTGKEFPPGFRREYHRKISKGEKSARGGLERSPLPAYFSHFSALYALHMHTFWVKNWKSPLLTEGFRVQIDNRAKLGREHSRYHFARLTPSSLPSFARNMVSVEALARLTNDSGFPHESCNDRTHRLMRLSNG